MEYINQRAWLKMLNYNSKSLEQGFTLIEVIAVIAVTAILSAIAVPCFFTVKEKACEIVCNVNCLKLKKMYDTYLILENKDHAYIIFSDYLQEYGKNICPSHGDINYRNRRIQCSIHGKGDDVKNGDEGDGIVPFL